MTLNKKLALQEARSTVMDIIAAAIWSVGIKVIAMPNQIAMGGSSGIAMMINYLTDLPIGTMSTLINIPLLIIAYRSLGKNFVFQTLRTLLIFTVVVDLFFSDPITYIGDPLLASLFGGVLHGAALSLVFMHGSTSGGTDIISRLVRKYYPHFSTGQLLMVINSAIMLGLAFVYHNIETVLYGLVLSFTSGKVIDMVLYGTDTGKCCMIVTRKPQEISAHIIRELHRSATVLDGHGAYQGTDTSVLLCVVRKQEFYNLKRMIRDADPAAFVIVSEAHQILGRGFKSIDASDL